MALTYFVKLADAGINGTKAGDANANGAFILPYQWLTLHYKDAKDEANMMKYANLGKKLFPDNDYLHFNIFMIIKQFVYLISFFHRYKIFKF